MLNKDKEIEHIYEELKRLSSLLENEIYYTIKSVDVDEQVGRKELPNTLIGSIPVCRQCYVVKEETFKNKTVGKMALENKYGSICIFFNKENAQEYVDKLNNKL